MKRSCLRITGTEEKEEYELKGKENIFNKIGEENFSNLMKEINTKCQKLTEYTSAVPL